ncbi:MAG: hypothetical protein AAB325_18165, partial [Pseudomonadota bacterium]
GPLYEEIVERTTRGFGADGAVLRIFYPEFDPSLIAEAKRGNVPRELLQGQSLGQGISGKVLYCTRSQIEHLSDCHGGRGRIRFG